jgi:hypothetical protein
MQPRVRLDKVVFVVLAFELVGARALNTFSSGDHKATNVISELNKVGSGGKSECRQEADWTLWSLLSFLSLAELVLEPELWFWPSSDGRKRCLHVLEGREWREK